MGIINLNLIANIYLYTYNPSRYYLTAGLHANRVLQSLGLFAFAQMMELPYLHQQSVEMRPAHY